MNTIECITENLGYFEESLALSNFKHFQNKEPNVLIQELEQLYKKLRPLALEIKDPLDKINTCNKSHLKLRLLELDTPRGVLKFEIIYFTGVSTTSPHTHPEFVIDEIISGTLQEEELISKNGVYQVQQAHLREDKDIKAYFDPSGSPHKVKAVHGPCKSFCLSLGFNSVTSLN